MIYLIGENVFSLNSGTEFSQFQRLHALKRAGHEVKIVTRNYNRFLSQNLKQHGLDQQDSINMYDFFQKTLNQPRKKQGLRYLESILLQDYHVVGIDNNRSEVHYQGKTIANIHVMPATVGLVGDVEYLDDLGHPAVREYWDWRGFKSMVESYHPDGTIGSQRFLDPHGQVVLEITHMNIDGQVRPTMWKLLNYGGHNRIFDSESAIFTFFLNELNRQRQGTFISDRRSLDANVLAVDQPVQTIAVIHSQAKDKQGIYADYQLALNGNTTTHFDKVALPTKQEERALRRFVTYPNCLHHVMDCYYKVTTKDRQLSAKPTLVYRGMLTEVKRILDLISAFQLIHQQLPNARFVMQGYFTAGYQSSVENLIKQSGLNDSVDLLNYKVQPTIYDHTDLFINASENEGLGMNMVESMSHGVPVISYDVPYVNTLLPNNNLVANGDPAALAKRVVATLSDSQGYAALSKKAYQIAGQYNETDFVRQWEELLG
ncbi:glycosyltransferase [Limosilactobacillus sp.]|uniref:glycosyltransferase n=1 Tax=Limosilactobacillus sp. TaxID=2773925 RepID=UPI00345ED32F